MPTDEFLDILAEELRDFIHLDVWKLHTLDYFIGTKTLKEKLYQVLNKHGITLFEKEQIIKFKTGNKQHELILKIGREWTQLLIDKNTDYGGSIFQASPLTPEIPQEKCILIRMQDKINRLYSLCKNEAKVKTESFDDTIKDLGAYCLLYLVAKELKNDSSNDKS